MLSRLILVLLFGLALAPSIAQGLPNPRDCGQNTTTTKKSSKKDASLAKDNGNNNGNNDPQTSDQLDPRVRCQNCKQDGLGGTAEPGQTASDTSTNNFINACLLTLDKFPIQNGQQLQGGACSTTPLGLIPSTKNMPSTKFQEPANFGTVQADKNFTVTLQVQNLDTGFFTNTKTNYYAAPQKVNPQTGNALGHTHVVMQLLAKGFTSTDVLDTTKFAFFKGMNEKAVNGKLSVVASLPAGQYRVASIGSAGTHQSLNAPVAQRGSMDDMIYLDVTKDGKPSSTKLAANNNAAQVNGKNKDNGKNVDNGKNNDNTTKDTGDPCTDDKATSKPKTTSGHNKNNKFRLRRDYRH